MKSFTEFLNNNITESDVSDTKKYKKIMKRLVSGQTISGEKPSTKKTASDAALDDAIGRKRTIETLKQDRLKREYGTAGGTGDSNMGAGAGGASGNKSQTTTKPIDKPPAKNFDIDKKHANAKVTYGQGIDTKKIAEPSFAKTGTNPTTRNTIPGLKKKPSLWTRVKSSYKDRGKGSGTIHKLGGALSGYNAYKDDVNKGRSKPRAVGKGLAGFASYMAAKPLSRVPKVGPVLSAVVGDILQKKSGKVYDNVANKVTGQTPNKKIKKKNSYNLPDVPLRGRL